MKKYEGLDSKTDLNSVDASLYDNLIDLWCLGEWEKLCTFDEARIASDEHRPIYYLLQASAYQNLGNIEEAKNKFRLALSIGVDKALVKKIVVCDAANTLGVLAYLNNNDSNAERYFREAVNVGRGNISVTAHSRAVRELSRLGYLFKASSLVEAALNNIEHDATETTELDSRIEVLKSEVELLHHELMIEQKRKQLYTKDKNSNFKNNKNFSRDELDANSYSQLGQDIWVLEQTKYKRGGFFVEFGATNGINLSNSYLLEKEFGWEGICAEPNPEYFEQLKFNRKCIVSSDCIGAKTGERVSFILAKEYGGIESFATQGRHSKKVISYQKLGNKIEVDTISLDDFLFKYKAPREIDFLSVDTEGSEFAILNVFPFNEWDIRLICVEHNFTPQREDIFGLLSKNGYSRIEVEFDDWYFKN